MLLLKWLEVILNYSSADAELQFSGELNEGTDGWRTDWTADTWFKKKYSWVSKGLNKAMVLSW